MAADWSQYSIQGKRAFVAGGSGGLGWSVAKILAGAGAELLIHGRDARKIKARASELGAAWLALEIGPDNLDVLVAAAADYGPQILVVALGPFLRKPLERMDAAEWGRTCALNLALPGALVSACLPAMLQTSYGRILLFGGNRTDVVRGAPGMAAYAAAKTGLGVIAKSVARAYAGRGLACCVACPGLVDTEYVDPGLREEWETLSPTGRLQDPENLAALALRAALDPQAAFNGAVLTMDGGFLA
jgi:NAD(P)-dependent dehydrogenase (short-subunit alcohol dehydrogenase family)